jgi:hypothetical protein
MFGQRLTVNFATRFIPFRQCARCHVLSHSTEECCRAPGYTRCHICGELRHTAHEHMTKRPNHRKHTSLQCDCPIKCFNCIYAGKPGNGHLAIDKTCPLKRNMRPTPPPSQTTTHHTTIATAPARVDA